MRDLLQKTFPKERYEQDSNLREETPLDFGSNALTTRPSQLLLGQWAQNFLNI